MMHRGFGKIRAFYVVMCCSVLQCVAVCCSVLQCVAVCCSVPLVVIKHTLTYECTDLLDKCVAVCCSVLQCVAACCSVLQCVAVCCSVIHLSNHCIYSVL